MKKLTKWNVQNLALWGGLCGAAYSLVSSPGVLAQGPLSAAAVGSMIGGALGGAVLLAIVASIRNAFFR